MIEVEPCHMLAVFKDYLIWDDTDFQCAKQFFTGYESQARIELICSIPQKELPSYVGITGRIRKFLYSNIPCKAQ